MREKYMVEELCFLEEMMLGYEDQMTVEHEKQAETGGKGFAEAKRKRDMVVKIMRLVRAEALNMEMREETGHYDIVTIAQMLLNESATARIDKKGDSAEVKIYDEVHGRYIAEFCVELFQEWLLFTGRQFL